LLLVAAAAAHATTIVMPSDEQLIVKSPVIVEGNVTGSVVVDRNGTIWTDTTVAVTRALKGSVAETITIHEIGGTIGDRITKLFGAPQFATGEDVLLFLEPAPHGGYRTMDLYVGKFERGRMMNGRTLWLRDDITADVTLLDASFQPIAAKNVQRDAIGFESFIADRIDGRPGMRNYGIENPVLDRTLRGGRIAPEFTLITEGMVYRWARFDGGNSAAWYSGGTQPGYSGGGVSEMQTAMNAWTSYSSAKILYTYAGAKAAPWGGLTKANTVNEVLFNDPNNEISGTWNPSTGGVVGTGGFNGVAGSAMWTPPFAADATHTGAQVRAYNISEGNLTIQDNVSPSQGLSSSRLAEIVSHEFGHTLGFGHSTDGTALMYPSVTGLGPQLRADDQLAARWLYPNGSVSQPPPPPPPSTQAPAAPSSLSAVVSGSTVSFSWNDNATNETAQALYLSAGSGAFTKVADFNANVTSAAFSGFSAGSYRAYIVASNSGGSAQSNTASFTVAAQQLIAAFTFSPQSGTAGVTKFTFYDDSRGSITTRQWNFGDGATASGNIAEHVYARAGRFTVTLTIGNGATTAQSTASVQVNAPLAAGFNFSPAKPTTNDTVTFTDATDGGATAWSWSFGDGAVSSAQNPTRRYASPGTYAVTLTAFRNSESASITKSIIVTSPAPVTPPVVAAFDASSLNVPVGTSVTFTDRSSGSPTQWNWAFGDGTVSSAANPSHAYAGPGTYTVTLVATNATSSSTASRQIVVTPLAAYRSLISVTAQTGGVDGTAWRTELSLFNAGTQGASITLIFLPGAGGSVITRSVFLSPRQSVTYANALLDLFGMPSGAGALAIEATSAGADAVLKVSSRTFTGGSGGTYGQSVPDVTPDALERVLYLTGIASGSAFRTNVGLVNRGAVPVSAALVLYDEDGATVGSTNVTVPENNFQQMPLSELFEQVKGRSYDVLTMRITAASADSLSAYASVVDNATQDPVYIQAVPAISGTSLTVPVVGRANGANGTFWRSDVSFFNPTSSRLTLSMRYGGSTKTLALDRNETFVLADVLSKFGLSAGGGTFAVSWSGNNGPVVTSRTYTSVESGGTYGQSIDPVAAFGSVLHVPGLRNDASYRTNVGFVNGGNNTETFAVTLLSPSGSEIATTAVTLDAKASMQNSVTGLFPDITSFGNFTLMIRGNAGAQLFAYGSMIDNASGDPVFFAGR
jgi:PKD repeat protein